MGYYTDFQLRVDKGEIPEEIRKIWENEYYYDPQYIAFNAKWYDYDEEMLKISLENPDVLYTLEGKGEEFDDLWINYYKSGKSQHTRAQIIYEEFDENKMS